MDAIDRKILSILIDRGRATLVEIGDQVGLSPPAVKRRIEHLERNGVIRGYAAIVDERAFGWRTEAFLEVFCAGDTSLPALRESLANHPEVVGAYTVAGDADALLPLRTADIAHLEQAIERIHSQPNVDRTKTQVVLTKLAERRDTGAGRTRDRRPRRR